MFRKPITDPIPEADATEPAGARRLNPDARAWAVQVLARATAGIDQPVVVRLTTSGKVAESHDGHPIDATRTLAVTVHPRGRHRPTYAPQGLSSPVDGLPTPTFGGRRSDDVAPETLADLDSWRVLPDGRTWRVGTPAPVVDDPTTWAGLGARAIRALSRAHALEHAGHQGQAHRTTLLYDPHTAAVRGIICPVVRGSIPGAGPVGSRIVATDAAGWDLAHIDDARPPEHRAPLPGQEGTVDLLDHLANLRCYGLDPATRRVVDDLPFDLRQGVLAELLGDGDEADDAGLILDDEPGVRIDPEMAAIFARHGVS